MIDVKRIKSDFPVLKRRVNGKPLVYLDSAATSQKPQVVIDAVVNYYQNYNANIHRGVHTLGDESTRLYEESRKTVAKFIGVGDPGELIFVRNATEAINLVAYSWGRQNIRAGDEILLTEMEHHSNIVPWQLAAARQKAKLRFVKVDREGRLDLQDFRRKLSPRTKIVAVVHVSNFLGTINPIREIVGILKRFNLSSERLNLNTPSPLFIVDGAQAVPHMSVDVKSLGCDFYAFSGHKMYGPMGIGCLWGKRKLLEKMPPFLTGGGMINTVDWHETTFTGLPDKFEAGTPNVAGAAGLAAAVKYLKKIGMENVRRHEITLCNKLLKELKKLKLLKVEAIGPATAADRGGLIAFTVALPSGSPRSRSGEAGKPIHAHDVAQILDAQGVAVRSGHHCVMPLHAKLGLSATTRVSFGIYNTKEDIDKFVEAIRQIPKVFRT